MDNFNSLACYWFPWQSYQKVLCYRYSLKSLCGNEFIHCKIIVYAHICIFCYAICITKVCKSYTKQFFFYIFIYTSLLFCVTIKFYKRKKKKNFDTCKQCFPTVQLLTWHCSSIFVFLTCTCCNIDYIFWYWLPFWSQIELLHIQIIYMYLEFIMWKLWSFLYAFFCK